MKEKSEIKCAIEVNLPKEHVAFTYIHSELDKTQIKPRGVLNLIDTGGITRTAVI